MLFVSNINKQALIKKTAEDFPAVSFNLACHTSTLLSVTLII
jgi:hypothetical protein